MKCTNCGFESEQDFAFCTACGTPIQQENVSVNTAAVKIQTIVQDNLFMTICILLSVSCGLGLFSGAVGVIQVLATIFLWLVYSSSRKGVVDVKNLRNLSGTVYANYVIVNVLFIILAVCGVLFGVAFSFITSDAELLAMFNEELSLLDIGMSGVIDTVLTLSGWLLTVLFLFVSVVGIVLNVIGFRKIHRFVKSAYQSVEAADLGLLAHVNAAKSWMWVFGIFTAISALSSDSVMAALSSLCGAAAYIIGAILIKKHMLTVELSNVNVA